MGFLRCLCGIAVEGHEHEFVYICLNPGRMTAFLCDECRGKRSDWQYHPVNYRGAEKPH